MMNNIHSTIIAFCLIMLCSLLRPLNAQVPLLDYIHNSITDEEYTINLDSLPNLADSTLNIYNLSRSFILKGNPFLLLGNNDDFEIYCKFEWEATEDEHTSYGRSADFFLVDKKKQRCFSFMFTVTRNLIYLMRMEDSAVVNLKYEKDEWSCDAVLEIRELDFEYPFLEKMRVFLLTAIRGGEKVRAIGDFKILDIIKYIDDKPSTSSWFFFDDPAKTYHYNIYQITYDDLLMLYPFFKEVINEQNSLKLENHS